MKAQGSPMRPGHPTVRSVKAYAALDYHGRIMPDSVRATIQGVRLAAGECKPLRVEIIPVTDDEDDHA